MLWRDILRPFMCRFSHVDRRCGHVSLSLLGHKVQLGFGIYVRGQNIFFLQFSMYWANLRFNVWVNLGVGYTLGFPEVIRVFVVYLVV